MLYRELLAIVVTQFLHKFIFTSAILAIAITQMESQVAAYLHHQVSSEKEVPFSFLFFLFGQVGFKKINTTSFFLTHLSQINYYDRLKKSYFLDGS